MSDIIKNALEAQRLLDRGMTREGVAKHFGVNPRTIRRWLQVLRESNSGVVVQQTTPKAKAKTKKKAAKKAEQITEVKVSKVDADLDKEADDAELYSVSVLASRKSVSLTRISNETGKVVGTVVVTADMENFKQIFDLVASSNFDQALLNRAYALSTPAKMVEEFTSGKIKVNLATKQITYESESGPYLVDNKLSKRIVEALKESGEEGAEKILNFLNRLMLNPSNRAVRELYGFLEHNDIKLTQSGKFIAWKVVRSTYMDKHSNTMDNSVGKELRVDRNQVDEDSEVTCSHGLHVCAKHYISTFYSGGDRIVTVEVDPADVVAIPKDYKNSKMRCCGYTVLEDVTASFKF